MAMPEHTFYIGLKVCVLFCSWRTKEWYTLVINVKTWESSMYQAVSLWLMRASFSWHRLFLLYLIIVKREIFVSNTLCVFTLTYQVFNSLPASSNFGTVVYMTIQVLWRDKLTSDVWLSLLQPLI